VAPLPPLFPGETYECDVEIVPSCIVVPQGWRVALSVRGRDYEYEGELSEFGKKFHYATRGTGGMTHDDPDDRPKDVFGGKVTLHAGGDLAAYVLLPSFPKKERQQVGAIHESPLRLLLRQAQRVETRLQDFGKSADL
jgi:hypothetical protein